MACKGRHTPLGFKIQKEEIQMRNLKRTLSLVLAAVMLVGMMVVSASAVSSDFNDSAEITNTEAVDVMTAIGERGHRPQGHRAGRRHDP